MLVGGNVEILDQQERLEIWGAHRGPTGTVGPSKRVGGVGAPPLRPQPPLGASGTTTLTADPATAATPRATNTTDTLVVISTAPGAYRGTPNATGPRSSEAPLD